MSVFAKLQSSFVARFLLFILRITIINPSNEPQNAPYIICSNHVSNIDPVILGASTKKPIRYMAKSELFKIPVLAQIIRLLGAYPVDRKKADVGAIKKTIDILRNGEIVGLYPAGKRLKKKHPKYASVKNGASMIACKAKVGVLPVALITKNYKISLFNKKTIVIGEYIPYEKINSLLTEPGEYKPVTDFIYGSILNLFDIYDNVNKVA